MANIHSAPILNFKNAVQKIQSCLQIVLGEKFGHLLNPLSTRFLLSHASVTITWPTSWTQIMLSCVPSRHHTFLSDCSGIRPSHLVMGHREEERGISPPVLFLGSCVPTNLTGYWACPSNGVWGSTFLSLQSYIIQVLSELALAWTLTF